MTTEPEQRQLDSFVSMKNYVDALFAAHNRAQKAERLSMDARLGAMNEFRAALTEQSRTFITRNEHDEVLNRIRLLELSGASLAGKASMGHVLFAWLLSAASLLLAIIDMYNSVGK